MKNIIQHLLVWIIVFAAGTNVYAQDDPMPSVPKVFIDCEKEAEFFKRLGNELCYDAGEYSYQDALALHLEILMLYIGCNDCPDLPKIFKCTTSIDNLLKGDLNLNENGDLWCSGVDIKFEWSCSKCIYSTSTTKGRGLGIDKKTVEGQEEDWSRSSLDLLDLEVADWRLYPNPTSGRVEIEVNIVEAVEELSLIAYDLSGKRVFQKSYGAKNQGLFRSRANLSNLADGWYVLSAYLDGELLGTEKVAIGQ